QPISQRVHFPALHPALRTPCFWHQSMQQDRAAQQIQLGRPVRGQGDPTCAAVAPPFTLATPQCSPCASGIRTAATPIGLRCEAKCGAKSVQNVRGKAGEVKTERADERLVEKSDGPNTFS